MERADLSAQLRNTDHPRATAGVLQRAIDQAGAAGGGMVTVPPGTWTITTIELRSGVTLHLQRGSVLRAHDDVADYEPWSRRPGSDRQAYHLLRADGCEAVTIEGDGMIDGNGEAFWQPPLRDLRAQRIDISADIARAPATWPLDVPFWRGWEPRVTPLIELRHCRYLALRDIIIRNSPGWTVHPFCCDQVHIDGITIEDHIYGPNTDGIDVNGCRDVFISNCRVVGCDDSIVLKATRDARSCERVTVTNCNLKTNCAALGIGAETTNGIRDVAFSNCVVEQALRMVQLEMWEPGIIENVVVSNISGATLTPVDVPMEKVVYIDIQQHGRPEPELGHIRNVVISGITARTHGRCMLTAQDGACIEDVTLRDLQLIYPAIEDASQLVATCTCDQNSNYNRIGQATNSVLVAENVHRLRVENLRAQMPPAGAGVPAMHGAFLRRVRDVVIDCPWLASNQPNHPAVRTEECSGVCVRGGAAA